MLELFKREEKREIEVPRMQLFYIYTHQMNENQIGNKVRSRWTMHNDRRFEYSFWFWESMKAIAHEL